MRFKKNFYSKNILKKHIKINRLCHPITECQSDLTRPVAEQRENAAFFKGSRLVRSHDTNISVRRLLTFPRG